MSSRDGMDPQQARFLARQLEAMPDVFWLRADPTVDTVSMASGLADRLAGSIPDGRTSLSAFLDAVHPTDRPQVAATLGSLHVDAGDRRDAGGVDAAAGEPFELECRLAVAPDEGEGSASAATATPDGGAGDDETVYASVRVRGETDPNTDRQRVDDGATGDGSPVRQDGNGGGGGVGVRATVRFLEDAPTASEPTGTAGTEVAVAGGASRTAGGEAAIETRLDHDPFVDGPVVMFRWAPEPGWPVEGVSPNVEDLLGYPPDALCAGDPPYRRLVHPEDRRRVARTVEENSENASSWFQHAPYRLLSADGEVRWVLDCTRIVRDDDGDVEAYVGYLVDITARKRRERQLEHAESLGGFGSWRWRFENGHVQWSEGLYDIFERDPDAGPLPLEDVCSLVHPEDRDRFRAVFERPIEELVGGLEFRLQLDDKRKWIDSRVTFERGGDGSVIAAMGVLKDVTVRARRERELRLINDTVREIVTLETAPPEGVLERIVECAAELVAPAAVRAHVRTDAGGLSPAVATDGLEIGAIEPGEGPIWDAFCVGESRTVDAAAVPSADRPPESMLVVPVGDRGVLLVGASGSVRFDDDTVELVELLASAAAGALERIDRTETLRERTAELSEHVRKLERMESLNEVIRSLQRALIESDSREVLLEEMCQALVGIDDFDGAWVGEPTVSTDRIRPVATAGLSDEYLDGVGMSTGGDEPTCRAIDTSSSVGPVTIPERLQDATWRRRALENGYRSALSVPIEHAGVTYGALTLYSREPETFGEKTGAIVRELGSLVGYALANIEHRATFHEDGQREMVFDVTLTDTDPIATLADRLSATVEIRNVTRRNRNATVAHCLVSGADTDEIVDIGSGIAGIEAIEAIGMPERSAFEVVTVDDSVAAKLTTLGVPVQILRVSPDCAELIVTTRRSRNHRRLSEHIDDLFAESEFRAKRETSLVDSVPLLPVLSDALTDQQRNVLKTAYYQGYFEADRTQTGSDIASSLGVAQSTFSKHLRAAQRNLFSAIWNEHSYLDERENRVTTE